jgi:DnaJ-class molecular chaperone
MDYYDLLGVKRSASADELKTAYKRQAMKNHPDKGGDPEKFKQINEAYQALSDPQQKQMYDQFGTTDPQQAQMNQGGFRFHHSGGDEFDDILRHFGFGSHFGQGFANSHRRKNKNIQLAYTINFEDIYTGKAETINFKLPTGRIEIIDIKIPPGVNANDNIRFTGYGDDSIPGVPRGDLILTIQIRPIKGWDRQGADLYTHIDVNILDLLTGTEIFIKTPDNKKVNLKIPAQTMPTNIFTISNYGLPFLKSNRKGNLFVKLNCVVPSLLQEDKNIISEIRKKY